MCAHGVDPRDPSERRPAPLRRQRHLRSSSTASGTACSPPPSSTSASSTCHQHVVPLEPGHAGRAADRPLGHGRRLHDHRHRRQPAQHGLERRLHARHPRSPLPPSGRRGRLRRRLRHRRHPHRLLSNRRLPFPWEELQRLRSSRRQVRRHQPRHRPLHQRSSTSASASTTPPTSADFSPASPWASRSSRA